MVKKEKAKAVVPASPSQMLNATIRANARNQNSTRAYYYGNMGDSIERRMPAGGTGIGGGSDLYSGLNGLNTSYNAVGYGNYLGGSSLNMFGRGGQFSSLLGPNGFYFLKGFSSNAAFNHQVVASCILAYLGYGVVRNIIDLFADFATEGLEIIHEDKTVRQFYNAWAKKVNLNERVHAAFLNLFITGNVFIYRRWANLSKDETGSMKRSLGSENIGDTLIVRTSNRDIPISHSDFVSWYFSEKASSFNNQISQVAQASIKPQDEKKLSDSIRIPWGYTFLNPLQMEMRGRKIQGLNYWVMALDKKDTAEIASGLGLNSKQNLSNTQINIPREFISRISKYQGPTKNYLSEIKLDNEELYLLQDRKFDWWDWSVPFVWPALRALQFKDCLRDMEIRACQSVINSIFLFKLGNTEKGLQADDESFERLADMLQTPGQALNIIWNDLIDADVIQADVNGIFDPKKHESADKDIATALGVPDILLGGKGGNFSNSFISVATVLEKLESARNRIADWLRNELKLISDVMKFKKLPDIKFGQSSLTDRKAEQTFYMNLFDRGIISADTLLKFADTTPEIEAAKQAEENDLRKGKKIKPLDIKGPYIKDDTKNLPKTANGRPPGSNTGPTGQQVNKREPQGKTLADYDFLLTLSRSLLDKTEAFINDGYCKTKGLRYIKLAPEEERKRLEQLTYNVFSHMPHNTDLNNIDDFLINILKSDAVSTVKANVMKKYLEKIELYNKTYNKEPTKEMRRQFIVSAWTQSAIENLE